MNDISQDNKEAYEYCRDNGHLEFVTVAQKCDDYVRGNQWSAKAEQEMKKRRKPMITLNRILSVFATLSGEQISRRGDVAFRAGTNAKVATASVLDKLWMNFGQVQKLNWKEMQAFWDGIIRGRGFLDLRISFDEAMRGEPVLSYMNSKDVLLYPDDTGYDPDDWTGVIITKLLSPVDVHELYGVPLDDVLGIAGNDGYLSDFVDWKRDVFGKPVSAAAYGDKRAMEKYRRVRVIERQEFEYVSADHFVDRATGEMRMVPESWNRERINDAIAQFGYGVVRKRAKKIRWAVSLATLTLHNSFSPYRHFTVVPYFPFVVGGKPLGIIEHLISPQDLLNKATSQELHIVAGIANSGWKVKKNGLTNMTIETLERRGGEDGLVLEYAQNPQDVDRLKPNDVPTGIDRLGFKASEAMQQISLVSESMQGLDRADVSGDAIQTKAERGAVSLSTPFATLAETRTILARNWLDLTQQYVSEERTYAIVGTGKNAEPEQVDVNVEQPDGTFLHDLTLGEFSIVLHDVKERNSFDMEQFGYMIDMIRQGAPIPWSMAVESLTILETRDQLVEVLKQREGLNPPGEMEQKMQELEMRLKEAMARDKEASANVKDATAQGKMRDAQGAGQPDPAKERAEMLKLAADAQAADRAARADELKMQAAAEADARKRQADELKMQYDQERMGLELQKARELLNIERERMQMELELAREQMAFDRERMMDELKQLRARNMMEQERMEDKRENDRAMAAERLAAQKAAAQAKPAAESEPKV
jgi:hypothetical protein